MPLKKLEEFGRIASDWVWQTGPEGHISYVSTDAERLIGRPIAELIGQTYAAMAWSEDAAPEYRSVMVERRAFRDLTYTYRHPDGTPRWFALSGQPIFNRSGRFRGYRGVGSDVSDRHQTRAALVDAHTRLVEQNRRFDAALENMSQGLCMFDAESRLMVWNRRYLDIFGLEREDLRIGMTQREIVEILVNLQRYKPDTTVDAVCQDTCISLVDDKFKSILRELADGRVIAVSYRPMMGGGWVATFEDVTERRRNEERIGHMARHDALTDLPNRAALRDRGTALLSRSNFDMRVAVLCLDLDRFKPINDSFGHATGDRLLRAVAERLLRQVRDGAIVARLGGDEFAVLHQVANASEAVALAQRLIGAISSPYGLDGLTVEVGMSVGIALSDGVDVDIERLLKHADMALYKAKAGGRGTHCIFEPEMDETARARLRLERELRDAVASSGFEVHYQPLVDLADNRVTGVEALVRWRHAERGLVSPGVFIPIAEETGLIVPLGEWILQQACRAAARWPDHVRIAVNVSVLQLRQRNFAASVFSALAVSGLDARRLELEITESVLLDDTEANLETLHGLRRGGVRIALDDFGTGYSSISYLRRFPFDKIKIDRSFVRDIGVRSDAGAIIRAIVDLAVSLGMTTLAEGVETEAQRVAVMAYGAQEMQGFLFSPPRRTHEIDALLDYDRPKTVAA